MIRLNANENPYNPLSNTSDFSGYEINRYPEAGYPTLIEKIAAYMHCPISEVAISNGSDDLLDALLRSQFNSGNRLLTLEPTFSEYDRLARINHLERISPPATGEGLFTDFFTLMDWIIKEKPEGLLLCNPNNPTGQLFSDEEVTALICAMPSGSIAIIDEAYKEFTEQTTPTRYVIPDRQVIQVRTLSKAFGFAGLRIGYGLLEESTMSRLTPYLPPYRIGCVNALLAEQYLSIPHMREEVTVMLREKKRLMDALSQISYIQVFEGHGNFIWAKAQNALSFKNRITAKRYSIRTFSDDYEAYIRISIGTAEENTGLICCLTEDFNEDYTQNL